MRHVAAYILAVMGGNKNPSETDLKAILSSVGIEGDSQCLSFVVDQLKGKNVFQVIQEGQALMSDMDVPIGGGGAPAAGGAAAEAVADEPAVEEKKPVVESSDSEDSDMGMGLFDD